MPLTRKGEAIRRNLVKEYGEKAGERILYAGANKGTFTGIDISADPLHRYLDACARGDSSAIAALNPAKDRR